MDLLTKLARRFFLIIIALFIVITLFMPMVKIKISDDKYIKQTGLDIIKSVFDDDLEGIIVSIKDIEECVSILSQIIARAINIALGVA